MNVWFRARLQPGSVSPAQRDLPLDGLRGLCAVAVFYAHLFLPAAATDPRWAPSPRFWYLNLGAPAVLMFFVLSGYVIGLVTQGPASTANIGRYLVHRAARLVPLNTAAVLLSALLLPHVAARTIAGNLLFLENSEPYPGLGLFPLLANNGSLWSLNYEAVYYLGFIMLWVLRPPTVLAFAAMGLVVIAHSLGWPISSLAARLGCGALYWSAGLAVAWHATPVEAPLRRTNWPAALLAFLAMWQAAPLREWLYAGNLYRWLWTSTVSPHRLDLLLACVWLLLATTGRAPRLRQFLTWTALSWATAGVVTALGRGSWNENHGVAAVALALAWPIARREYSLAALGWCAPLGAISFALYIIASPLQIGQRALWPEFSGSALTFTIRAVLLTALVLATAWLLERRVGPPISAWIRRFSQAGRVEKT